MRRSDRPQDRRRTRTDCAEGAGKAAANARTDASRALCEQPPALRKVHTANSWDAGVYAKAGANQDAMNQIARFQAASNYWASSTMPRADEAKKFYDDAINFAGTMAGGGFDNARLTEYVNSMLSGAWTDMAAEAAGYKGLLQRSDRIEPGHPRHREPVPQQLLTQDAIRARWPGSTARSVFDTMQAMGSMVLPGNESITRSWRLMGRCFIPRHRRRKPQRELSAWASSTGPSNIAGNRNYDLRAAAQLPGAARSSYEAWPPAGLIPRTRSMATHLRGANGIDTGQGGVADPNNKSGGYRLPEECCAVYGNVPALPGAGSGVSGVGSGGSGAGGGGIAAAAGSTGATPATGINLSQLQGASGWNVTPNQTVQGQLEQVIAADSPLMQQARILQQANQRGVLNSTWLLRLAIPAVLDAASAIAQQDAGDFYSDAARFNADSANTFSRDNNAFVRDAFMADFNLGANEWAQQDFARQYQMLTRQQQLQLEQ